MSDMIKTRLIDVMLMCPSFLVFLFYVTQPGWIILLWKDFFQNQKSFEYNFDILIAFGLLFVFFLISLLVKMGQLFFVLFQKRCGSVRNYLVQTGLILALPIAGVCFSNFMLQHNNTVLKTLKYSFEQKKVNLQELREWLSTIHPGDIDPLRSLDFETENPSIPQNVRQLLITLNPDVVFLRYTTDNRVYINITLVQDKF